MNSVLQVRWVWSRLVEGLLITAGAAAEEWTTKWMPGCTSQAKDATRPGPNPPTPQPFCSPQVLWALPELRQRYVDAAAGLFRSAPSDAASDFATQFAKVRQPLLALPFLALPCVAAGPAFLSGDRGAVARG